MINTTLIVAFHIKSTITLMLEVHFPANTYILQSRVFILWCCYFNQVNNSILSEAKYSFILKYCLSAVSLSVIPVFMEPVHFQWPHLCGYNMLILSYPFHSDICPAAKN